MLRGIRKNVFSVVILSLTVLLMTAFSLLSVRFSSVFYILASGMAGVCLYLLRRLCKREGKDGEEA